MQKINKLDLSNDVEWSNEVHELDRVTKLEAGKLFFETRL